MLKDSKSSGFTIVEIAVVIVVIAILAIVTVASFDSVQKNVHESVTASNVEMYVGALEQIHQDTGKYPLAPSMSSLCVGTVGCNNKISYAGAGCSGLDGVAIEYDRDINVAFNSTLLKYLDELPDATTLASMTATTPVELDAGTCTVKYTTDGSLTYESGIYVERNSSGRVSLWRTSQDSVNTAAYRLTYTLPGGDAACHAKESVTVYNESLDVTTCQLYGGKTEFK